MATDSGEVTNSGLHNSRNLVRVPELDAGVLVLAGDLDADDGALQGDAGAIEVDAGFGFAEPVFGAFFGAGGAFEIDLAGSLGGFGENADLIRKNFGEAPGNGE